MNDSDSLDAVEFRDLEDAKMYSSNGKNLDVNEQDGRGQTPVMLASYYGHLDTLRWLLSFNVNLDIAANKGRRAIDLAKENDHKEYISLILSKNA